MCTSKRNDPNMMKPIRAIVSQFFKQQKSSTDSAWCEYATRLEVNLFKQFEECKPIEMNQLYCDRAFAIMSNLLKSTDQYQALDPNATASLSLQDMHVPDKPITPSHTTKSSTDGLIECKKCRSKDVIWHQKQTSSGDESMTIFCECRHCSARFVIR